MERKSQKNNQKKDEVEFGFWGCEREKDKDKDSERGGGGRAGGGRRG